MTEVLLLYPSDDEKEKIRQRVKSRKYYKKNIESERAKARKRRKNHQDEEKERVRKVEKERVRKVEKERVRKVESQKEVKICECGKEIYKNKSNSGVYG